MKLSMWAKKQGIAYSTAWRMFKSGHLKRSYQLPTGTIIVQEDDGSLRPDYTVVYARVSSSQNRINLDTQADRVSRFCSASGWVVNAVVKECASGLNDTRPKLQKILCDTKVTRIVVEHKDRLTRFGFNYIKTLFRGELVIINHAHEDDEDLMQDFVNLVTSFCARLYGRRRSRRKTEELIEGLRKDDS